MVVVILIAILAVIAIPSMSAAKTERRVYQDAGSVMQLLRTARTRALARGAATVVSLTSNGTTDRGKFQIWEAVGLNPSGSGAPRWPVSSCRTPNWTLAASNTSVNFIEEVDLNLSDSTLGMQTQIRSFSVAAGVAKAAVYICYTPLGRALYSETAPQFAVASPMLDALEVRVGRCSGTTRLGLVRSVIVPPSGMARLAIADSSASGCP